VDQVLVIERFDEIDHLAGVTQLNGRERLDFAHFERD